jgi:HD-GYP domain-containing protein (c-di-GMP phosphodiesterase class II)
MEQFVDPDHNDKIRELLTQLEDHAAGERGHANRVSVFSVAVGERLGMEFEELVRLRQAASLHDIGKIYVESDILKKPGTLTDSDLAAVRLHAGKGRTVIESLTWLAPAIPMITHHHERWDGAGYPDGLAGENIPLGARIIAVAEAFDTLTGDLKWRTSIEESNAIDVIRRGAGSQFDPRIVETFLEVQPLIQPILGA